uniref:uncharacterized protein LOC120340407 n=1 Tax=Styela clava TaxID=7725 RepID=UPI00193A0350|nr:uncharacterized protein LOC120340407 [Styela clava]
MASKYPLERLEDVFQEEVVLAFPKIVNFKKFARSSAGLRLDQHEIDDIVEDFGKSVEEQKLQMLMKWQQNSGSAATVSKIRAIVNGYKTGNSNEDYINVGGVFRAFRDQPLCGRRHVYRGEQLSKVTGPRPVAIKFLDFNKRNLQEAKVLLKLALHPNVVSIIHSDEYHGDPFTQRMFIVMELCHDENLTDFLKNREKLRVPFEDDLAISFAQQLLHGLQFIHRNDVIHRDLKPDNILLSLDEKTPKISDFGLSKELRKGRSYTAQSIMRAGTDGFRAPETYNDDVISEKSDTYSMGLVIYAVWSNGKHPFGEDPDGWNMYIKKNKNRDLSHLLLSDKTKAINLLDKMLQFEPKNRPTADKLLVDELFRRSVKGKSENSSELSLKNMNLESEELESEVHWATGQIRGMKPSALKQKPIQGATKVFNANDENVIILSFYDKFCFYKPATKEWHEWKKISVLSNCYYSIVAMNNNLYVLMANVEVHRTKYPDSEPIWERLSDMMSKHGYFPPAVVMNGYIYVCGGLGLKSRPVERYNPENNEWRKLESMKIGRNTPVVITAKGRLYCFGGIDESLNKLESGEVFDPESSKWEFTAPMPVGMEYASAAQSNDLIYIAGGQVLLCYDINNNSWPKISLQIQLSDSRWRFIRIVALNNEIYFIIDAEGNFSLYKFDPETNQAEHVDTDERFKCESIAVGHM